MRRIHCYSVYIMTNWNNTVMYTGMTGDLEQRVYQHKHKTFEGFTKKYNVCKLVYYDSASDVHWAIAREKEIKGWRRSKKNALVEEMNPTWKDLSLEWEEDSSPCQE